MADAKLTIEDIKEALKIHEFSSTLVPGVFFLYGLNLIFSHLGQFISGNISIGSLVIFLLLSYGLGHFIQSVGNLIEIYIIKRVFGDLKKLNRSKKVEDHMVITFKNHKKVCRGIATSLLLLLIFTWISGIWNVFSIYSLLMLLASLSLFGYMRRYQSNELGI